MRFVFNGFEGEYWKALDPRSVRRPRLNTETPLRSRGGNSKGERALRRPWGLGLGRKRRATEQLNRKKESSEERLIRLKVQGWGRK